MNHFRKTIKKYRQGLKQTTCPFCNAKTVNVATDTYKYFYVVENLTKYDLWDAHEVREHLLLVPKRHVESIAEFKQKERREFIDIVANYEKEGYSIWARDPESPARSVDHQHTHFIKVRGNRTKFVFFLRKPYLLFRK